MRNKKILLVTVLLLLVATGISFFIPVQNSRRSVVKSPPMDLSLFFQKTENYALWFHHPRFEMINPVTFRITDQNPGNDRSLLITLAPDIDPRHCLVSFSLTQSLYQKIAAWFSGGDLTKKMLSSLSERLENTLLRYGFDITLVPVYDSVILTVSESGPDLARSEILQDLYQRAKKFLADTGGPNQIPYYYVSSAIVTAGVSSFSLGIPVERPGPSSAGFSYFRLPAAGRVLVGKGTVETMEDLIAAMNRYLNEQGLRKVAQQMERYNLPPSELQTHPETETGLIFPVL